MAEESELYSFKIFSLKLKTVNNIRVRRDFNRKIEKHFLDVLSLTTLFGNLLFGNSRNCFSRISVN